MKAKFGSFVKLMYDRRIDYLFDIESEQDLTDAIEYKNNMREKDDRDLTDIEYIFEYLDNNKIDYDYIYMFNVNSLEY